MLKTSSERNCSKGRISDILVYSKNSLNKCGKNLISDDLVNKTCEKVREDSNVSGNNSFKIEHNKIKSNCRKKSIRLKLSKIRSFFSYRSINNSKDVISNKNIGTLSKVQNFMKRISIKKKLYKKNSGKVVFNSNFGEDNVQVNKNSTSVSSLDKKNIKSPIELKFTSLLLNNINIAEDVNIRTNNIETNNLKTNTSSFLFRDSAPINEVNNNYVNDNRSVILERNNEKLPELIDKSDIGNINNLISDNKSRLFRGFKSKNIHVEEYLKIKFKELLDSRILLNEYLKEMKNSDNSDQLYNMNFKNKYNSDVKINNYMRLASKLSEVSFDCLLSNPNELSCQLAYNKDGLRVWKKEYNSGRVLLRTEFIVPISPLEYLEYVTDSNNRRVYDNNTVDLRTLENILPGLDVMYVATKRIATVYPRDIVNIRFIHGFSIKDGFKIFNKKELNESDIKGNPENFIFSSCTCSIEHPDAPERQGYVRMDLSIGSYMAIPIKTPFGIWSSISMFNEASPKGWIPSSVTKMIVAKMVPGSVENIISSILTYYKLPYKNKIGKPYSGFCNKVLTTLYTDQKKLDIPNFNNLENTVNQKTTKLYSKLSFLFNKPLLMSIQEFIALYKSNSLQEFIEHFNSTQLINRMMYNLKSSPTPSHIDLLSSSTDTSRNISLELDNSNSIDTNLGFPKISQKQDVKFGMCNFSLEKIPNDYCDYVQNKPNITECKEKHNELTFKNLQSCESLKSNRITNKENFVKNKFATDYISNKNSRFDKFSIIFGSSQIFEMGDSEMLTRIFSLD